MGPRDPDTMIVFAAYLDIVTRAAYTLVVVVMVVAAVDRLLLRRRAAEPGPDRRARRHAGAQRGLTVDLHVVGRLPPDPDRRRLRIGSGHGEDREPVGRQRGR